MRIALDTFGAEIPKIASHLLPAHNASIARNSLVVGGDLQAFRAPLKDSALTETSAKSLYLYEENGNSHWVVTNTVRHYVKSTIAGDAYERVYFTGESEARFFANDNISGAPPAFDHTTDYYKLGIPAPTTAPTVTSTGGGAVYKGYVYSYANHYGDEGPPSAVGSDNDFDSGAVGISDIVSAPASRAIDRIYLYRTNASGTGTAEFQFVLEAEFFSATAAYAVGDFVVYSGVVYKCTTIHPAGAWNAGHFTAGDDVADSALLSVYPKTNFDPPPSSLKNLISLANGSLAGFVGNQLYFSEPYYPHAWPTEYIIPFDATIIGLGVEKNTITVVTAGSPHIVYGTHPSIMTKDRISKGFPGLYIRSVISAMGGTAFITQQGLILSSSESMVNITQNILDPDDWAEYSPSTLSLYFHDDKVFGFDSVGEKGFIVDIANNQFIPISVYAHAGFVTKTGDFYLVLDDTPLVDENDPPANMPLCVSLWEGDTTNYLLFTWRSKEFILRDTNFSIAHIILDADFYDAVIDLLDLETLNAAIFAAGLTGSLGIDGPIGGGHELGGDEMYDLGTINISSSVTFKLYANGSVIKTKSVNSADMKFRLPAGQLYNKVMIGLIGFVPVKKVVIATSVDEL